MVDVAECFLSTCRERRATSRVRRVGEYEQLRRTLAGHESSSALQSALDDLEAYIAEGRCELAAWESYILDLEGVAVRLRRDLGLRCRMEDRAAAKTTLASIYRNSARRSDAVLIIQTAVRSFAAKVQLSAARHQRDALLQIQSVARSFLAKCMLLRSKRRSDLGWQLVTALQSGTGFKV